MELERRRSGGPRDRRSRRGEGGVEGRRRGEAGAADLDARRQPARRSAGSAARPARTARRQSAQTRPRPQPRQAAHRLGQRRTRCGVAQAAQRAGRRHRLNILPAMASARSRARGAPPRRGRGRAGAAPAGAAARAALAARRGRPPHGRAPVADAAGAGARARLVGRPRRRHRRAATALPAGARSSPSSPTPSGRRARAQLAAALVAARPRGEASTHVAAEPDAALGRAGWSGPTWCCTASPIRRRCSRAGTRLLAVEASSCSPASARAPCASCASSMRRLGWPAPTPGFIDMHDLGDMLVAAGFADPVIDQETLTLSWTSAEALLGELRVLGGNAAPDRFAGLRTPRWRAASSTRSKRAPAPTAGSRSASRSPTATPSSRRRASRVGDDDGVARRHARDGAATVGAEPS